MGKYVPVLGETRRTTYRGFRFESFWTGIPGYTDKVAEIWNQPTGVYNAFLNLHIKLQKTAKSLKQWARATMGKNKLTMVAAKKLIGVLDVLQEFRQLSDGEIALKRDLKNKLLGYAAVEKLRTRQQSRLTWIKPNDAKSKLFFLSVNGRKRKNAIQSLVTPTGHVYTHQDKAEEIFKHFNGVFGNSEPREYTLDWETIRLPRHNLQHLEESFSEEEIHRTVMNMPSEKAPGPDGFIGIFFKTSWHIIKADILTAIDLFFNRHMHQLNLLNSGHVVLIQKHAEAQRIGDYRPISLSHSIAKLISKLMANRLAGVLDSIVSRSQSAFINKEVFMIIFCSHKT